MSRSKAVAIAPINRDFVSIPSNNLSADTSVDLADSSVFGSYFQSNTPTLASWDVSTTAILKDVAGYTASIRKATTSSERQSVLTFREGWWESEDEYSLWDYSGSVVLEDGNGEIDVEDIEEIDYLHGRVKFKDYEVVGQLTATHHYYDTVKICDVDNLDLNMSSNIEDMTDFCYAQDNEGYRNWAYTQLNVSLSLGGFDRDITEFMTDVGRDLSIIEISLDKNKGSVARGYFTSVNQQFDGWFIRRRTIEYELHQHDIKVKPFSWKHKDSSLPESIRWVIDAWENRKALKIRYIPIRENLAIAGDVLVAQCGISVAVDGIPTFDIDFQGVGMRDDDSRYTFLADFVNQEYQLGSIQPYLVAS